MDYQQDLARRFSWVPKTYSYKRRILFPEEGYQADQSDPIRTLKRKRNIEDPDQETEVKKERKREEDREGTEEEKEEEVKEAVSNNPCPIWMPN